MYIVEEKNSLCRSITAVGKFESRAEAFKRVRSLINHVISEHGRGKVEVSITGEKAMVKIGILTYEWKIIEVPDKAPEKPLELDYKGLNNLLNKIEKQTSAEQQKIEVDTPIGKLVAYASDDPEYPGIYVDIEKNGESFAVALIEYPLEDTDTDLSGQNNLITRVWNDVSKEDYTTRIVHSGIDSSCDTAEEPPAEKVVKDTAPATQQGSEDSDLPYSLLFEIVEGAYGNEKPIMHKCSNTFSTLEDACKEARAFIGKFPPNLSLAHIFCEGKKVMMVKIGKVIKPICNFKAGE